MNNKKKMSIIFASFGVYLVVCVILAGVYLLSKRATREINEYKIQNEDVYMFFEDERFDYSTEMVLDRNDDVTSLKIDGQDVELYNELIYIKDKDEVILSSDMAVVFPLEGIKQKKANFFSKLVLDNNNTYLKKSDGSMFDMKDTFLYDGNDLYFFCDNVSIFIGSEEIKLPAFSYVICQYNGNVYLLDYSTKNVKIYENNGNNVRATNGLYAINLSYDSVQFNDKNILLMKNVKNLKNVK